MLKCAWLCSEYDVFLFSPNSHFGFYNSNETVVEMKEQDVS